jgi:tight adherence protein B
MELIISALVFLTIVAASWGINRWNFEKKERISRRLGSLVKSANDDPSETEKKRDLNINRILGAVGKNFSGFSFAYKIESNLDKADILLKVEEFIGLNILVAIGGGLLGLALSGRTMIIVLCGVLAAIIPGLFVYSQKQKRAALLSEEIGETLTGMSNSLRAGYSFQQAMELVSKETQGPLGKEYRRTLREINLGVTTEQALQNLINRAQNEDLELMISSVLIQRSIGGNLAEVFDKIADTIRQRIRMKGEVKVLTAQGRASAWIIGLMPVALIVAITLINPDYLSMFFETTLGWMLLGGAAVSELVGFLFINRIINIEF